MAATREIYLDANATVPPLTQVVSSVGATMRESWGNPSSAHSRGVGSRRLLEKARDAVCLLVEGLEPDHVVLTSGGTEGSNTVLAPAMEGTTIVTTKVEHSATLEPAARAARRGAKLAVLPVGSDGQADPEAFLQAAREAGTKLLVSVQWANGETGVIQPIAAIADAVRTVRPDAYFHVDAAQAIGRIATPVLPGVSVLTFSGHKLHGPQGTGALAYTTEVASQLPALMTGGGQERNRRSGSQNVAGAAGLAVALEARAKGFGAIVERMQSMRDLFEARICALVPAARINAGSSERVPNTSSLLFPGVDGMVLVAQLDQMEIRCSQGSACSSARPEPSHVLRAMGLSESEAYSSVRFSFSELNHVQEIEIAARAIATVVRSTVK